jgi:hypothetical protein
MIASNSRLNTLIPLKEFACVVSKNSIAKISLIVSAADVKSITKLFKALNTL